MEVIIITLLIILNGVLSMSEMSVVSAKRSKLKIDAKKGSKSAQRAIDLSEKPDNFLSTVQVGITLIGILTGLLSGEAFTADLAQVLAKIPVLEPYAMGVAETIIVILVTYFTLILGELVPKRIGMIKADSIAKSIALPMMYLSKLTYPIVWILAKSTNLLVKILGLNTTDETKVTEEEIKAMVDESLEDGEIDEVEHDMVERVFNLGDRCVSSLMTHRTEVVYLDINSTIKEIKHLIVEQPYSSYPIVDGSIDKIVGITTLKLIISNIDKDNFSLQQIILPPAIILDKTNIYKALDIMKESRQQVNIIVDEYGGLQGIITLKDIIEGVVGDIPQLDEPDEWVVRADGSILVDGQYPFFNFLEYFELEELWEDNDYDTLGGLIINELGHIPQTGDSLEWNNFSFEIIDMDGARIDKVLIVKK